MPSVGLYCIAKNEEQNLPRFRESLKDCFDQLVLVDTGSTDRTVELAKELGFEVHHFDWIDDFAAARNFALSKVTQEFSCWLDLDDVLSNAEGFKQFKRDIMGLGDYWVANYNYSMDKAGKPTCTFIRERVVRMGRGLQWRYFLHEGIPPVGNAPLRVQSTRLWEVNHLRTDEDMKKDKSRNLKIIEGKAKQGKLDPRMTYYYGKELFESGQPVESIPKFLEAASSPELELHDRILCHQYTGWAYMQCNQFQKAIEQANLGLMIAPHRAEFHVMIGDSHLKQNNFVNAIPFYHAAKNCMLDTGANHPIFYNAEAYKAYPANQLSRIYANIGKLDEAIEEAKLSARVGNHEGEILLNEIIKMTSASTSFKNAEECGDIVLSCINHPYEWDANIAKTRSMGGSETAAIEMAYHLHKQSGRKVIVFNKRTQDVTIDGVEYISNAKMPDYFAKNKPWLHIAWRHNLKLTDAKTFLWGHDLWTQGAENAANYVKHLCLTPFHKRWVMGNQMIAEDKIYVTRNGIKPERFKDGPWTKDPFKFVFPNSPDRGLDRAMLVLDKVRESYPKVTLDVFYGVEHLDQYGHTALKNKLLEMFKERPWVTYHGATQQDKLMEAFKGAAYWLSPSDWIETSCISAMEFIGTGIYPIFRGIGGIVDTLAPFTEKGMATQVNSEAVTDAELGNFVRATLHALDEEKYKLVNADMTLYSWEKVAQEWLSELPKFM